MAVLITMDIEASAEQYDAVNAKIDPASNPPAGLLMHVGAVTDSAVHIVDVWESEQQFTDFRDTRLGPAVGEVMGESAGPPDIQVLEVHDFITP
jgi:hypothetical protein